MDYLVRKVLTETQYNATKETLDPYEGVVVVNDADPTEVLHLAIGQSSFTPASSAGAPATATFLTNTDQTTDLPNSINVGGTNLTVGSESVLMNNPTVYNEANISALELTTDNTGFLFVDNAGHLSQTAYMDFTKTSGRQDITWGGVGALIFDATSYALNGNFVGSDYGFDGNVFVMNIIESNTTDIVFRRKDPGTALTVTWQSDVTADFQGTLLATLPSGTGTAVVVGAGNQLFQLTSSRRFKENIEPITSSSELLTNILKLEPVTYTYKNGSDDSPLNDTDELHSLHTLSETEPKYKSIGLVAEDVNELFPELVNLDEEGKPFSLNYSGVGVLLINAIKELKAEIDALKQTLNA